MHYSAERKPDGKVHVKVVKEEMNSTLDIHQTFHLYLRLTREKSTLSKRIEHLERQLDTLAPLLKETCLKQGMGFQAQWAREMEDGATSRPHLEEKVEAWRQIYLDCHGTASTWDNHMEEAEERANDSDLALMELMMPPKR